MENKKTKSMVSSMKAKNQDVGKVYPKTKHPSFDNPTYGILNNLYEAEAEANHLEKNLKRLAENLNRLADLNYGVDAMYPEDIETQLDPDIKVGGDKNSETDEYDHLDYNRSIYINDLSENYCSGSPSSGIQQAPANSSLSGETFSGTHV